MRDIARLRQFGERLTSRPHDPGRSWRGTAKANADLRIQRYGGCEFREMNTCHSVATHAGYPRNLAERMAQRGQTLEFSDRFTSSLEVAPKTPEQLQDFVTLTGPPDLALLQIGTLYSFRSVLGLDARAAEVRDKIGRKLGSRVFTAYRIGNPLFRHGRLQTPYRGPEALDAFAELLRAEWPQARLLAMGLFPVIADGAFDPTVHQRVSDEILERAASLGIPVLPMDDVVPRDPAYYCANGAQLNHRGGELVAEVLDNWLIREKLLEA